MNTEKATLKLLRNIEWGTVKTKTNKIKQRTTLLIIE